MSIDDDDGYKVGYGKPPKYTRFQKGHSGNPRGRPSGANNFRTDVLTTLKASVKVTRDGKPRKVSTQEAALLRLREQALGGNTRALDRLLGLAQIHNSVQLLLGHTKIESTVRYLGIEVDDALAVAEQIEV